MNARSHQPLAETSANTPAKTSALPPAQWLHKLRGDWVYETIPARQAHDDKSMNLRGVESVRSLGDLWVVCGGHSHVPGGGTTDTLMTLGFDPQRQRFVGTWTASAMPAVWACEGDLDATQQVLTLDSQGPCLYDPSRIAHYRDVIEWVGDDRRRLTSYRLDDDGHWAALMSSYYLRKTPS